MPSHTVHPLLPPPAAPSRLSRRSAPPRDLSRAPTAGPLAAFLLGALLALVFAAATRGAALPC